MNKNKKNIGFNVKLIEHIYSMKKINQVVKSICGDLLGQGLYRDVHELKQDNRFVVKIERDMSTGTFANATEWRNYIDNKEFTFLNKWMAPCEVITENGQILIQERIYWEGKRRKDYPKRIPIFFTDTKLKNFGWRDNGDFVCCDYSFMPVSVTKTGSDYMKSARWWGSLKE